MYRTATRSSVTDEPDSHWNADCQNYADSAEIGLASVVGGPAGV